MTAPWGSKHRRHGGALILSDMAKRVEKHLCNITEIMIIQDRIDNSHGCG